MKRRPIRNLFIPFLILTLALTVITGCGTRIEPIPTVEPTITAPTQTASPTTTPVPTAAPTAAPSPSPAPTPEPTPEPSPEPTEAPGQDTDSEEKPQQKPITNADGSITVFTVKQLLDAIAPGQVIELAEGVYNISDFYASIDATPTTGYWYFDWGTLTLYGVNDLTIRAREGVRVELVTEDWYADVLKLELCENVCLEGLTMGHAVEPGHCSGGVVELSYCKDVRLLDLDLYGCGTYGIVADRSILVTTTDCVIRECTYGIMHLYLCSDFFFNGCTMRDCRGFEQLSLDHSVVTYADCTFIGNHSDYDYGFLTTANTNDVYFTNCSFDTWELEKLEKQAPELSRVTFPWDEEHPCSYRLALPKNLEEFIEAIQPHAMIQLRDMSEGTYDLTAYLEAVWAEEGNAWNERHEYVKIVECYDGLELQIQNCDGLSIIDFVDLASGQHAPREFTVDPRYATVLRFVGCNDLTLRGFTLGHTETGECFGNVLALNNCKRVVLRDLELFGCGFYGLELTNHCAEISVYNSIIRDCSAGPICMEYCDWNIMLVNCTLTGSASGGYYWSEFDDTPYFLRCTFGDYETTTLLFQSGIQTELCQWSDSIMEYPDYSEDEWEEEYPFDPANAVPIPFNGETLASIYWVGWQFTQGGADEPLSLPCYDENGDLVQFCLSFQEDGTGIFQYLIAGEIKEIPLTWVCAANYSASVFLDDSGVSQGVVALYEELHDDEDGYHHRYWLLLSLNGDTAWFY